jgi:hypothetical protein
MALQFLGQLYELMLVKYCYKILDILSFLKSTPPLPSKRIHSLHVMVQDIVCFQVVILCHNYYALHNFS